MGSLNIVGFIVVVILYVGVVAILGYMGFKRTKNSADFMLGGRTTHPFVMALSYGAAFISTSAIVGFGGIASFYGFSMLWLPALNVIVGIVIAYLVYGKRMRKMGLNLDAHTFPEFMGKRLDSKFIQWFAGLIIFIFMPIYAAAVLIGAARILEGLVGIPYIYSVVIFSVLVSVYVILGGLKGMMFTDALQATLMFVGMGILLVMIYAKLGGVGTAHRELASMANLMPAPLQAKGLTGWTTNPRPNTELWWYIFSSLVLGVGIGALAQPQLAVRFMTVKSDKELDRAAIVGSIFILVTVGTPYLVGALSNVYFYHQSGQIAFQMTNGNPDALVPALIASAMPKWFGYLFLLVILSAAISTMSSQFFTIGTSISRDFYKRIAKHDTSRKEVLVARAGILFGVLVTVLLGFKLEPGIVARATSIFFGLMASSFLAPFTAALFWKRLTRKGAIAGIVSGVAVEVFMFLFTHAKEATTFKLCKALTGKDVLFGGMMPFVDPMVFALPISILFTIVVTLLTKPDCKEATDKSFTGVNVKEA